MQKMTLRTILMVDDEPDMEMLIRQKFRKQISSGDYRFYFAANGLQALEQLTSQPEIELVITDINMPVMNGLQLLEKIADSKRMCKCIVISAYTDIQNIRTAMNRGAFDFITKPIDFIDLETTISKTYNAIDESKTAHQALLERDQALKDREHAIASERFKQQFLANMSHEIRTPMNSVIGITHLLLRSSLDDQQRKYITMVQAASEQLMSIINDILDISKIEAGKMLFEHIDFDVHQVLTNVRNILAIKAEEKQLIFKMELPDSLPKRLNGDPTRLGQVLINLVGNAIKFTDSGFVTIGAKLVKQTADSSEVEFSVTDSGIGIDQDKLASIFESFTQANSDTSRKYGGTGLGLTISKQLVELQGGKISLESRHGIGTRFYFTLPFNHATTPLSETITLTPDDDYKRLLNGISILLVEDNDFNRIVAEDTLNEYLRDIRIEFAGNGSEAVSMVALNDYDLVLMDIQMPEMDGYEATRTIRNMDGNKKDLPIMAMTANATPEEINKCFESGVDEYISKPFVAQDLFQKMAKLVKKSKISE